MYVCKYTKLYSLMIITYKQLVLITYDISNWWYICTHEILYIYTRSYTIQYTVVLFHLINKNW